MSRIDEMSIGDLDTVFASKSDRRFDELVEQRVVVEVKFPELGQRRRIEERIGKFRRNIKKKGVVISRRVFSFYSRW